MLAPLRRCVDGWPCMVGDLRGRKMRTGSKIENPSTSVDGESRELQLLLFNFFCYLNRAAYKCRAEIHPSSTASAPRRYRIVLNVEDERLNDERCNPCESE